MNHRELSRVVVLVSLLCSNSIFSSQVFCLKQVQAPSVSQIKVEREAQWQRQAKRFAVRYGSIVAIVGALYVSYKASEYFKDMAKDVERLKETEACNKLADKLEDIKKAKKEMKNDIVQSTEQGASLLKPVWWVTSGIKSFGGSAVSFGKDLGKCFIESAPLFIAGKVLDTGWTNLSDKRFEALKQESITWFFENNTTLPTLFVDLKTSCVPYDLYSDLLSNETLNGKASTHMKSFVKSLSDLVKAHKDEDILDDEFFEYQCDEVKKQFMKKGSEVEVLQNYATPAAAKKQRVMNGDAESAYLFGTAKIGKQDITDLCNVLVTDVQRMAAFATVHIDKHRDILSAASVKRGENKVKQMIEVTNVYLAEMQNLLNTDIKDLIEISKSNHGMFTITYEFEKVFKEIVTNIHRYCLMIDR